jgi:hypothetical protein
MQEAEHCALNPREMFPVRPSFLEKTKRTIDVCLDKLAWTDNGAIDVALSRKIDDATWSESLKHLANQPAVVDVSLHEVVALRSAKVVEVAGIRKLIQVDHQPRLMVVPMQDKIRADEAGAAGDKN